MLYVGLFGLAFLTILYLFFRIENLKRELAAYRRQLSGVKLHQKTLAATLLATVRETQSRLLAKMASQTALSSERQLVLDALVQGMDVIAADMLENDRSLHEAVKKYFTQTASIGFAEWEQMLQRSSGAVKKYWQMNNVAGLLQLATSLIEGQTEVTASLTRTAMNEP